MFGISLSGITAELDSSFWFRSIELNPRFAHAHNRIPPLRDWPDALAGQSPA